ncbi:MULTISPECIES: bifunctional folylpolyglutamate synthase/dihydrofolate synthase [Cetobacterium]|uniref:tetrahydrofolate synthase n=1 Tax=Candidatus Cetobacterium colombiensis TaxID=3073100 RepID=A0ABU4W9A3_9FUSO|nr:folylpolyglutamate synthase/dihydrofolate synthase family protein [Candidatus Cetobacterium colombiensis]MDX8335779.1 folylpolyglutamate synthase/dihydrofolate synthase family protein [Candidatus Cetobacterium colombiensis]
MNIEKLLDELYSYSLHGIKLGLKNIEDICLAMGNPQKDYKTIHVAGTNGKGSTSTTIETVLIEDGKTVGKYTSPHILKFNERISVNGKEITDEEIAYYYSYVKDIVNDLKITPTFFEVTTAMMFKYFSDKKVEFAVIEVGMGGRFDATNVIDGDICIVTNVSLDHTEFLGKTVYEIACEKAGIIKKNSKVIVGSSDVEFLKAIEEKTNNYIDIIEKYKDAKYFLDFNSYKTVVELDNEKYKFSLFGDYQYKNFLCAFEALKELKIPLNIIKRGIEKVKWQCRFEIIQQNENILVLDGAHNEEGMRTLCETLSHGFSKSEVVAIVSILKDKDYKKILGLLEKSVDEIVFTSLSDNKRGQSALELYNSSNKINKNYKENIVEAYDLAKNMKKKVILLCGSFYLLSKFKEEVLANEK